MQPNFVLLKLWRRSFVSALFRKAVHVLCKYECIWHKITCPKYGGKLAELDSKAPSSLQAMAEVKESHTVHIDTAVNMH